jgi:hypothetical protein
MATQDVKRFGTTRKVFRGKGKIKLADGSEHLAQFTLAQLINTELIFIINIKHSMWDFLFTLPQIICLDGTLSDGRFVHADGFIAQNMKQTSSQEPLVSGYVSQWQIGRPDFGAGNSVSFELVNFRFLGTESEFFVDGSQQRRTLSLMTLKLGDRDVGLRWIAGYDQVLATLQAQHGVQVTCTATTVLENPSEIDTVVSVIDTLCDVVSVARGTLVSWTSFDVYNSESQVLYSSYRNSVTRRFSGTELIVHNDGQNTRLFIERGFMRCQELEPDFSIRSVARAFTETRDGPFINSRSLLMGVLVEHLASVRARVDNRLYFLDKEIFDSQWDLFKAQVKTALTATYPDTAKEHLPAMLSNIKGLNRRPFTWKINDFAKRVDLKFERGEVERFVQTRNLLAHESRFPENETPAQHYLRMQHFMDRVMLRLFDYHGPYYDIEHKEIRQI